MSSIERPGGPALLWVSGLGIGGRLGVVWQPAAGDLGEGWAVAGFVVVVALGNNRVTRFHTNSMSSKQHTGLLARAREERESRGLSVGQMGDVLGLAPSAVVSGAIQGFESGQEVRNGAVVRIYESLRRARQARQWLRLPKFTVDSRQPGLLFIHHNDYPRFVGVAVWDEQHKEQWRFERAGMPAYELDPRSGWRQLIVSFVDHVAQDFAFQDSIQEAIRLIEGSNANEQV